MAVFRVTLELDFVDREKNTRLIASKKVHYSTPPVEGRRVNDEVFWFQIEEVYDRIIRDHATESIVKIIPFQCPTPSPEKLKELGWEDISATPLPVLT